MSLPPSPQQLQLVLAWGRDVRPTDFTVFATAEAILSGARVRMHVIGASSLVLVETPESALAELIACGEYSDLPAVARARVSLVPETSASTALQQGGFTYSGRLWAAPLTKAPLTPALPHAVEYCFPGPGSPLTRIEAAATPGGLLLRTRHDYPEAGITVWSESEWVFRSTGPHRSSRRQASRPAGFRDTVP